MAIETRDPATGELIQSLTPYDDTQVADIVQRAAVGRAATPVGEHTACRRA